ncbi:MAG: site-specific integrase [Phycisphaerae bacterium]|nr:site-specific integrase [Phycisphaerae bacterium]
MPRVWKRPSARAVAGSRWQVTYTDYRLAAGEWVKWPRTRTGYPDKAESLRLGFKLELDAARRRDGLLNDADERRKLNAKAPIDAALKDFSAMLAAKGNTARHVQETTRDVERIAAAAGWSTLGAIDLAGASRVLATLRARDQLGARTLNRIRAAVRCFTKWNVLAGKIASDPLVALCPFKDSEGARVARRAASDAELAAMLRSTAKAAPMGKMSGRLRALLYHVAAETGLRRRELRSLTPSSFSLGAEPYVKITAAYSKRRREDIIPLRMDFAATLRQALRGLDPVRPIFHMGQNPADLLRRDIKRARDEWIKAGSSPAERAARIRSDFLTFIDRDGRRLDLHALRHSFVTRLARANVPPKVAQKLARHSTITLTMNVYAHLDAGAPRDAVESLPRIKAPATGGRGPILGPKRAALGAAHHRPALATMDQNNGLKSGGRKRRKNLK